VAESGLKLRVEQEGDVTVIRILSPRIAEDVSRAFEDRIVGAVEALETPKVVLDFAAVRFISSSVLGKLIKLNGRVVHDRRGRLGLCCLDKPIAEVFKITGLEQLFSIHPSRDEAVRALT